MSVFRQLGFACDADCTEEFSHFGGISIPDLAREARKEGWHIKSPAMGPHVCPKHFTEDEVTA